MIEGFREYVQHLSHLVILPYALQQGLDYPF